LFSLLLYCLLCFISGYSTGLSIRFSGYPAPYLKSGRDRSGESYECKQPGPEIILSASLESSAGLSAHFCLDIAIAAKDRFVFMRLKGHTGRLTALGTNHRKHLPLCVVFLTVSLNFSMVVLFRLAASLASSGLIDKTLSGMELLLVNRKSEILFAVNAIKTFFFEAH
jgi:hypothetical protein